MYDSSLQPTTGERWAFYLFMMSLMSRHSIVCTFVLHMLFQYDASTDYFYYRYWLADIRNWIRNIEQHASDTVNKILVGNKADMDESKRVYSCILTFFYACFFCNWLDLTSCCTHAIFMSNAVNISYWTIFRLCRWYSYAFRVPFGNLYIKSECKQNRKCVQHYSLIIHNLLWIFILD